MDQPTSAIDEDVVIDEDRPSEPLPRFRISDRPSSARSARAAGPLEQRAETAPPARRARASAGSRVAPTLGWLLLVGAGIVGGYVVGTRNVTPTAADTQRRAAVRPAPEVDPPRADAEQRDARASVEPGTTSPIDAAARVEEPSPAASASAAVAASAASVAVVTHAARAGVDVPAIAPEAADPPPTPSGPDTGAMASALAGAADGASGCTGDAEQTSASVGITFSPSGDASIASLSAPPSAAACVRQYFSRIHVPPFLGTAVTAYKSFPLASR